MKKKKYFGIIFGMISVSDEAEFFGCQKKFYLYENIK